MKVLRRVFLEWYEGKEFTERLEDKERHTG
ncbi:hypothetical protein DES34_111118 [Brevibacillus brevis]|nr:hypothetical protein DES34_111118 [Brevibacillus brevis]VEF88271.1 Uncharacterised protein [Brevibacillus brevis]